MKLPFLNLENQKKSGDQKEKLLRFQLLNIQQKFMFMGASLRKDLEGFIALLINLMQTYYVLFIRTPYSHLLKHFLVKIIILGVYKRIMILSTHQEKPRTGKVKIMSSLFLG